MDPREDPLTTTVAKKSLLRRLLASRALYAIVAVTIIGFVLLRWVENVGGPAGIWERYGLWAPAITVPMHALIAVTPFPSDVFGIASGAIYGFLWGTVLSWIGWFAASFLQYAIGFRAGKDFDVEGMIARSPSRLRRFPVHHPAFLIFSRYVPYIGGHLSTLLPGAVRVPLRRYAWCTALSIIPEALLMAGIGVGLLSL